MKNLMDATRLHLDLVDIDTYAAQLHLFSKQKKLIFRNYLKSQGIEVISIGGDLGRADLANRLAVESLLNSLCVLSELDQLLSQSKIYSDSKLPKGACK
jgi:hypothetical protein